MSQSPLRKARTASSLAVISPDGAATLPAGEWFVEQRSDLVKLFRDPHGTDHAADMTMVDFLDGLARREIVFVSWG